MEGLNVRFKLWRHAFGSCYITRDGLRRSGLWHAGVFTQRRDWGGLGNCIRYRVLERRYWLESAFGSQRSWSLPTRPSSTSPVFAGGAWTSGEEAGRSANGHSVCVAKDGTATRTWRHVACGPNYGWGEGGRFAGSEKDQRKDLDSDHQGGRGRGDQLSRESLKRSLGPRKLEDVGGWRSGGTDCLPPPKDDGQQREDWRRGEWGSPEDEGSVYISVLERSWPVDHSHRDWNEPTVPREGSAEEDFDGTVAEDERGREGGRAHSLQARDHGETGSEKKDQDCGLR